MQGLRTDDLHRVGARPSLQEAPPDERRLGEDGSVCRCLLAGVLPLEDKAHLAPGRGEDSPYTRGCGCHDEVGCSCPSRLATPLTRPEPAGEHVGLGRAATTQRGEELRLLFSLQAARPRCLQEVPCAGEACAWRGGEGRNMLSPPRGARREVRRAAPGSCATIAHRGSPLLQRVHNGGMGK